MRIFRQFGVLALLLVSCVAPAMACMVPNARMNTEERACCRAMKNQCGQMEMPESHGCCQKTPPSVHDNALDTKAVTFHPVAAPVIWLAALERESGFRCRWVGRTPDYISSRVSTPDNFHPETLVSSSLALYFAERVRMSACASANV